MSDSAKKVRDIRLTVPAVIIIAGVLIAGSLFFRESQPSNVTASAQHGKQSEETTLRPVSDSDHVRGNPRAKISIIEFSDLECPFCARHHNTMSELVRKRDDVNWVYRHFPLTTIHGKAQEASIYSECISDLVGNEAFWTFTDEVFKHQRSMGKELYESIAIGLSIPIQELNTCLEGSDAKDRVNRDNIEATRNGGRGTPYNIILTDDGRTFPFSGALPIEQIESIIDQIS